MTNLINFQKILTIIDLALPSQDCTVFITEYISVYYIANNKVFFSQMEQLKERLEFISIFTTNICI